MKKFLGFLILGFLISTSAFAGTNKATASVDANRPISSTQSIVEFSVRAYFGRPFYVDQQYVQVLLTDNTSAINNAVQIAAQAIVNNEFGEGTITDKNDIRLDAGIVS